MDGGDRAPGREAVKCRPSEPLSAVWTRWSALTPSPERIPDLQRFIARRVSEDSAFRLGLTLVTNNVKHFGRIPGLAIENWL